MDESDDNCCILPLLLGATKAPAVEARRERRRHFIVAIELFVGVREAVWSAELSSSSAAGAILCWFLRVSVGHV